MNLSHNGFVSDIEEETKENDNFRKVIYTGKHSQLVLMSLKSGEEIGLEVHEENDQFFRIEQGKAKIIIDGEELNVEDDFAIVVKAGSQHNIINVGDEDLKLYTIYSPAHHPDGTVHRTKQDADASESH